MFTQRSTKMGLGILVIRPMCAGIPIWMAYFSEMSMWRHQVEIDEGCSTLEIALHVRDACSHQTYERCFSCMRHREVDGSRLSSVARAVPIAPFAHACVRACAPECVTYRHMANTRAHPVSHTAGETGTRNGLILFGATCRAGQWWANAMHGGAGCSIPVSSNGESRLRVDTDPARLDPGRLGCRLPVLGQAQRRESQVRGCHVGGVSWPRHRMICCPCEGGAGGKTLGCALPELVGSNASRARGARRCGETPGVQ